MSNWKKKTLKEVVKLWVRGSTPRRNNKDYYCGKEGIPFVRAGDLRGGELKETELYLTWEGAEQVKGRVPKGALLLSVSGTIGKTAIAGREVKVNQAVQAMVFDESELLSEYVYYYFQFFRPWLEERANTVTIPNLTKTKLEQTSILFPCLEEQIYCRNYETWGTTVGEAGRNQGSASKNSLPGYVSPGKRSACKKADPSTRKFFYRTYFRWEGCGG